LKLIKFVVACQSGPPFFKKKRKGGDFMSSPVKKFSAGGVQVAVWENEGKEGTSFYTASIDRAYKDKNDEWKHSNSLKMNDIPKAVLALQKAYEFMALKEPEIGQRQEKMLAEAMA